MHRHKSRRALAVLLAGLWYVFFAASAAATPVWELLELDRVHAAFPNLDGVDDVTGEVQRIAVIDTGIDHDHPQLGGRTIAGVNYAAGGTYGSTLPVDFDDRHGHGTFVTGLMGSQDPHNPGVLPRVEFVSVRTLAANAQGSFADVARGLEWVRDNADRYNITAVNISLGSSTTYTAPTELPSFSTIQRLEDATGDLEDLGLVVVAASGNGGSTDGLSLPAILEDVIAVGASDTSDRIAGFSNRNDELELLAPGTDMQSLWKDGGISFGQGTSFAAPLVTAASVLLREAYSQFTDDLAGPYGSFQDRLVDLLQRTGDPIYDAASGRTYAQLNLEAALVDLYGEFGVNIPEPASLLILLIGLTVILRFRRAPGV